MGIKGRSYVVWTVISLGEGAHSTPPIIVNTSPMHSEGLFCRSLVGDPTLPSNLRQGQNSASLLYRSESGSIRWLGLTELSGFTPKVMTQPPK